MDGIEMVETILQQIPEQKFEVMVMSQPVKNETMEIILIQMVEVVPVPLKMDGTESILVLTQPLLALLFVETTIEYKEKPEMMVITLTIKDVYQTVLGKQMDGTVQEEIILRKTFVLKSEEMVLLLKVKIEKMEVQAIQMDVT